MNIILIGMRGSGKTTIGKMLAEKLNMGFIETDAIIEKKIGESIIDIIEKSGWQKFRKIEHCIIKEVSSFNNCIISTGGGVVLNNKNVKLLRNNGIIIWLDTDVNILINRIGNNYHRPFLTNKKTAKEDITEAYNNRIIFYKNASSVKIVNNDYPIATVNIIINLFLKLDPYVKFKN